MSKSEVQQRYEDVLAKLSASDREIIKKYVSDLKKENTELRKDTKKLKEAVEHAEVRGEENFKNRIGHDHLGYDSEGLTRQQAFDKMVGDMSR